MEKEEIAEVYYYRGVAYDMCGQTHQAERDLGLCLEKEPEHTQALYSRSLVRRNRSDWDGAFEDVKRAYALDAEDFRIANAYAQFLCSSPMEAHLDGPLAVKVALQACEQTEWGDDVCMNTLADAFDLVGDEERAAHTRSLTRPSFADVDDEIMGYLAFQFQRRPEPDGLQEIVPASKCPVSIRLILSRNPDQESIIFSVGMSAQPMFTPDDMDLAEDGYAELVMRLPADWPLPPDLDDEQQSWPLLWLRRLAHYPHLTGERFDTCIFPANGESLEPLVPGSEFAGFVLLRNVGLEGFRSQGGHMINLITAVPITAKEHRLACQKGLGELARRLVEAGNPPSLIPGRACVG